MSRPFDEKTFRDKQAGHHRPAENGKTKIAVTIEGDATVGESGTALESISAIKCLYNNGAGILIATDDLDFNEAQVIGISRTSATSGNPIKYLTEGRMEDSSFSFAAGSQLYLGQNGEITDQEPTQNFRTKIGSALEGGAIMINIDEPIEI